jgi:hypothetical protein
MKYATRIGGTAGDRGQAIAVDAAGNAYVTGYTHSNDFPTVNPFQKAFGGGNADAIVLKLRPMVPRWDTQATSAAETTGPTSARGSRWTRPATRT